MFFGSLWLPSLKHQKALFISEILERYLVHQLCVCVCVCVYNNVFKSGSHKHEQNERWLKRSMSYCLPQIGLKCSIIL